MTPKPVARAKFAQQRAGPGAIPLLFSLVCFGAVLVTRGEAFFRNVAKELPSADLPQPRAAEPGSSFSDQEGLVDFSLVRNDGSLRLPHFNESLNSLQAGRAEHSARILWLGDFHTAVDDWPQRVREKLQARFGAGGPGLVMLGLRQYRHAMVTPRNSGDWKRVPSLPADTQPKADGVLGLLGMGAIAQSTDAASILEFDSTRPWTEGVLSFELLFRLPSATSQFEVVVGADSQPHGVSRQTATRRSSGLLSYTVETQGEPRLAVSHFEDNPSLFGVIVESRTPGVVVDTLGIDGARAATALSWNSESWEQEVRMRNPALVIVAYGTNEVEDDVSVKNVERHLQALVERIHRAAPDSDCLLIGPTDRARKDWTTLPRVVTLDAAERRTAIALGCSYFSALQAMGGKDSLQAWSEQSPPLARRDRLRLTRAGYGYLGDELFDDLMLSYETWLQQVPRLE